MRPIEALGYLLFAAGLSCGCEPANDGYVQQAAAGMSQSGGDPEGTGRSPFVGPDSPALAWRFDIGSTECRYQTIATAPVVDQNGNLYFGTSEGELVSLTPWRSVHWRYELPDAYPRYNCGEDGPGALYDHNVQYMPAIADDAVLFGPSGQENAGILYALGLDGLVRWTLAIDGPLESPIKIGHDGRIYFTTPTTLYSIRAEGNDVKSRAVAGRSNTPVVARDGTVFVASTTEGLLALDSELRTKWTFPIEGGLRFCDPAIDPETGVVYFPVNDEYELDAVSATGALLWTADIFWSEAAPAIGPDGTVYVGATDLSLDTRSCDRREQGNGVLFAFSREGVEQWRYYVPAVLKCRQGEEDCPDADCWANGRAIDAPPVVDNRGTIYFGTDAKQLIALWADGSEKWIYTYGDEWDNAATLGSDGVLYTGPRGLVFGGLVSIGGEAPDTSGEGTPCQVGPESGTTCASADRCSSGEWAQGCCIGGSCM